MLLLALVLLPCGRLLPLQDSPVIASTCDSCVKTVDSHFTTRGQDNRLFTCNNVMCVSVVFFLDRLFLFSNVKICTGYHRSKTD